MVKKKYSKEINNTVGLVTKKVEVLCNSELELITLTVRFTFVRFLPLSPTSCHLLRDHLTGKTATYTVLQNTLFAQREKA